MITIKKTPRKQWDLVGIFMPNRTRFLLTALLVALLAIPFLVMATIFFKKFLDDLWSPNSTTIWRDGGLFAGCMLLYGAVNGWLLSYMRNRFAEMMTNILKEGQRLLRDSRVGTYGQSPHDGVQTSKGNLVRQALNGGAAPMLQQVAAVAALGGVIIWLVPLVGIVIVVLILGAILVMERTLGTRLLKIQNDSENNRSTRNKVLRVLAPIIGQMGMAEMAKNAIDRRIDPLTENWERYAKEEARFTSLSDTLFRGLYVLLIGGSIMLVHVAHLTSVANPSAVLVLGTVIGLFQSASISLFQARITYRRGEAGMKAFSELFDKDKVAEVEYQNATIDLDSTNMSLTAVCVEVRGPDRRPILNVDHMHIPHGRLAVVEGSKGSGTTILARLLSGNLHPQVKGGMSWIGKVLGDGFDIAQAARHVTLIHGRPPLFFSTENDVAKDTIETFFQMAGEVHLSEKEIERALRRFGLLEKVEKTRWIETPLTSNPFDLEELTLLRLARYRFLPKERREVIVVDELLDRVGKNKLDLVLAELEYLWLTERATLVVTVKSRRRLKKWLARHGNDYDYYVIKDKEVLPGNKDTGQPL